MKCLLCKRSHCYAENRCVGKGPNEGWAEILSRSPHAMIHMGYDLGDFDQGGSNRSDVK